ncbi:MAG: tRNA (N6-isopentenyl adenosine(37)-C2)-methylthiotransferase MiaB [Firmicutes bacterium]|nr:tRNA (N6-isopentenyl adenosine(37)-C2)-methylthiotransferase MiaB [Bacillota bacterium]
MKELQGKKYHIITFGCQMNEHDSETIAGLLREEGSEPAEGRTDADIVIINTCSVRENADKRFFGTLGQLKKLKAINPAFAVCVCGCMMQQEHIVTAIRRQYPWVDVIFGTHNIHEFPEMLQQLYRGREAFTQEDEAANDDLIPMTDRDYTIAKHAIRSSRETRVERIYKDREEIVEGLPAQRLYKHKAFVNIMYGCNNFCTYCIVPYTRGREKSRHPEDILAEVRALTEDGVKEVTLLGQNVNSYRGIPKEGTAETQEEPWDFTDLIYALNEIPGLARIRFMTSHPKDLSDKLIGAFRDCEKLCHYIHLPVQSGSTQVLKRMNRKYTQEQYLSLVRKLREAAPEITISTDIIVGFPGETEEDFEETLRLVKEVEYDSAFTFLYSKRQGTPAAEYGDQVPEETKHERFGRLVDALNEISLRKNAAYIGRTEKVLVDGTARKEPGMLSGRTDGFKLVDFPGDEELIGTFAEIEITEGKTFSLKGRKRE